MNRQEKIAYLQRYRDNEREIDRLFDEIERTRSLAEKVTASFALASAHGDYDGDQVQAGVEQIGELCERLNVQLSRKVELRDEIERAIDTVEDERLREVLELRYMDIMPSFERIAVHMNYSRMQIFRMHLRAIDEIML